MVKEKAFIVDMRERTARGIWKSTDSRLNVISRSGATSGAGSERGGEDQEGKENQETEDPEVKRTKGEARECTAEKAELCRKEKLGGRRGLGRVGSERY